MINKTFLSVLIVFFVLITGSLSLDKRNCKCRIGTSQRIIGGKISGKHDYGWMVSINLRDDKIPLFLRRMMPIKKKLSYHSCGGSIINSKYILTAAHCVPGENAHMSVGYGNENDLVKIFEAGRIKVKKAYVHPNYNQTSVENDIAILELSSPIKFGPDVSPACITKKIQNDFPAVNTAGFGLVHRLEVDPLTGQRRPGNVSRYLKDVDLKDVSSTAKKCQEQPKLFCADKINKGESSCAGDSGGSILTTIEGKTYVVGLTSYTDQYKIDHNTIYYCLGLTYYTRVASFIEFIESVVGKDEYCSD